MNALLKLDGQTRAIRMDSTEAFRILREQGYTFTHTLRRTVHSGGLSETLVYEYHTLDGKRARLTERCAR